MRVFLQQWVRQRPAASAACSFRQAQVPTVACLLLHGFNFLFLLVEVELVNISGAMNVMK